MLLNCDSFHVGSSLKDVPVHLYQKEDEVADSKEYLSAGV